MRIIVALCLLLLCCWAAADDPVGFQLIDCDYAVTAAQSGAVVFVTALHQTYVLSAAGCYQLLLDAQHCYISSSPVSTAVCRIPAVPFDAAAPPRVVVQENVTADGSIEPDWWVHVASATSNGSMVVSSSTDLVSWTLPMTLPRDVDGVGRVDIAGTALMASPSLVCAVRGGRSEAGVHPVVCSADHGASWSVAVAANSSRPAPCEGLWLRSDRPHAAYNEFGSAFVVAWSDCVVLAADAVNWRVLPNIPASELGPGATLLEMQYVRSSLASLLLYNTREDRSASVTVRAEWLYKAGDGWWWQYEGLVLRDPRQVALNADSLQCTRMRMGLPQLLACGCSLRSYNVLQLSGPPSQDPDDAAARQMQVRGLTPMAMGARAMTVLANYGNYRRRRRERLEMEREAVEMRRLQREHDHQRQVAAQQRRFAVGAGAGDGAGAGAGAGAVPDDEEAQLARVLVQSALAAGIVPEAPAAAAASAAAPSAQPAAAAAPASGSTAVSEAGRSSALTTNPALARCSVPEHMPPSATSGGGDAAHTTALYARLSSELVRAGGGSAGTSGFGSSGSSTAEALASSSGGGGGGSSSSSVSDRSGSSALRDLDHDREHELDEKSSDGGGSRGGRGASEHQRLLAASSRGD